MFIKNILIKDPLSSSYTLVDIVVNREGLIQINEIEKRHLTTFELEDDIRDAEGKFTLFPGLLDTHVHGYGGHDFSDIGEDPESLQTILKALAETGLSYVMPTFVSLPIPKLMNALKVINDFQQNSSSGITKMVGVHLEGPCIDPNNCGAHDTKVLQDKISMEQFREIMNAAPNIKEWKITIAPDLPGAMDFIQEIRSLQDISVKVFFGHTNPDSIYLDEGMNAGAAGITHLGNACSEERCRSLVPLEANEITSKLVKWVINNPAKIPPGVELITDGKHISEAFVTLIRKHIGDKIVIVSDALGPSGKPDGKYRLGSLKIEKQGAAFYLDHADSRSVKKLAGSAASYAHCIQKYWQWTDKDAVFAAAITNPRSSALSENAIKSLPDDKNFAIFDKEGQLVMSLCQGKLTEHLPLIPKASQQNVYTPYKNICNNSVQPEAYLCDGEDSNLRERSVLCHQK